MNNENQDISTAIPILEGSLKKAADRLAKRICKDRPLEKNKKTRSLLSDLTPFEIAQSIRPQHSRTISSFISCFKVMSFSGAACCIAYMSTYGRSVICAIYIGTNCYILAGRKASHMNIYEDSIHKGEIKGPRKSMHIYANKQLIAEIKRPFRLGLFDKYLMHITSGPNVIIGGAWNLFPEPTSLQEVDPDIVQMLLITVIWRAIYK